MLSLDPSGHSTSAESNHVRTLHPARQTGCPFARDEATRWLSTDIETEHLLLGILQALTPNRELAIRRAHQKAASRQMATPSNAKRSLRDPLSVLARRTRAPVFEHQSVGARLG